MCYIKFYFILNNLQIYNKVAVLQSSASAKFTLIDYHLIARNYILSGTEIPSNPKAEAIVSATLRDN